jgi:chromosome segregation ATPase
MLIRENRTYPPKKINPVEVARRESPLPPISALTISAGFFRTPYVSPMASLGSLSLCPPCSGPIDEAYINCIRAYQVEIGSLKQQLGQTESEMDDLQREHEALSGNYTKSKQTNRDLQQKVNSLEKTVHHQGSQLREIEKRISQRSTKAVQVTIDADLREENAKLKSEVQHYVTLSNQALDGQQRLVKKVSAKSAKLAQLRSAFDDISLQLKESTVREEETTGILTRVAARRSQLKKESRRLAVRLSEAEANIAESERTTSRLRELMNETVDRQQCEHATSVHDLNARLADTEFRLHDAERRVIDFARVKTEYNDVLEKLEESQRQCKQLMETLQSRAPVQARLERQVVEFEKELGRLQTVEAMNADLFERVSISRDDQRRIADLQQENEQLRLRIDMSELSNTSLSRKVRESEIKNSELQRQVFDLQGASDAALSVSTEADTLRQENRRLRREIDGYDSPARLTAQLKVSRIENHALHQQIENLIDAS